MSEPDDKDPAIEPDEPTERLESPELEPPSEDAVPVEVAGERATEPIDGREESGGRAKELELLVEQLNKEKKDTHERLLRTAADFDNFRKRSRREMQEAEERGRTTLLKELLPAVDNLERAVAHQGAGGAEAVIEGVKLVLKQVYSALERFSVRAFDSIGKPFDPSLHEAVQQVETSDHPVGTVVTEFQRGYTIGERLLRPAMVVVARAKSQTQNEPSSGGQKVGQDGDASATNGADSGG
jgi:molecular chaperone GrpE